jgi:hypothetical protein
MENEILSIDPNRNVPSDPYVVRLPDGPVRVTATSILFPETCPRCGSSPASTNVSLHSARDSSQSIKLPFCKRCGWSLNITQYLFAAILCALFLLVLPHLRVPTPNWLSKVPPSIVLIAAFWIIGWAFQLVFKVFYKPGVEVVAAQKDSIELAFDDQMYAERFVELNR